MADDNNKPVSGTLDPLFGATPAPTEPGPSAAPPPSPPPSSATPIDEAETTGASEGSEPVKEATIEPLFGATPPAPAPAPVGEADEAGDGAKGRLEATSRERVRALKAARENAMANSSAGSSSASGSTPSSKVSPMPSDTTSQYTQSTAPPPIMSRPTHAPIPTPAPSTSMLPTYLRKLTYIISILLGTGATIASIWSLFLLPLLHASFSARRALVEQQLERWTGLVGGLRDLRGKGMFQLEVQKAADDESGGTTAALAGPGETAEKKTPEAGAGGETERLLTGPRVSEHAEDAVPEPTPLLPDLTDVMSTLDDLASTRSNTATTRLSLLSTLEAYTSSLHRQLWSPRPGHGGYGVGLNSLNANLAKERGSAGAASSFEDKGIELPVGVKGEEYDAVRKEIRTIKGILLNRRNFDTVR